MTPPMSPSPPGTPPPPNFPCGGGCPGNLFISHQQTIRDMQFGSSSYPYPNSLPEMCYSTLAGDAFSSSTWHTKCNGAGNEKKSVWIAKVESGGESKVIGAYSRLSWYSSGYADDATAGLFQVHPVVFKTTAGSGPYSGSSYAIYRSNNYGPTFGNAHDWYTTSNMKTGYCNLGYTYKCRIGNYNGNTCRNDFAVSYNSWAITEQEMWLED